MTTNREFFLRHRNGGGKVYGWEAEVSADTHLDSWSVARDQATIVSAHIENSMIYGASKVFLALIRDNSEIYSAGVQGGQVRINRSTLIGADVCSKLPVLIKNTVLSGEIVVRDSATLIDVSAIGQVRVYGHVVLEANSDRILLRGLMDIHRGFWRRAPKYVELGGPFDEQGFHFGITECTDGHAHVGCKCKPMTKWLEHVKDGRLARVAGWRNELVQRASDTFTEWLDTAQKVEGPFIW